MVLGVEEGSIEIGVGLGVGVTVWMRVIWVGWLMRWCCFFVDIRCIIFFGLREERKRERSSY